MLLLEFNLVLIILTIVITNIFCLLFARHYGNIEQLNCRYMLFETIIAIIVTPWFFFLSVFLFIILIVRGFHYIFLIDKIPRPLNGREFSFGQKIRISVLRSILAILLFMLCVFFTIVLVGRIMGADIISIISLSAAVILATYIILNNRIPLYNKEIRLFSKTRQNVAFLIIVVCLSSLSIFNQPFNCCDNGEKLEIRTMSFNILYAGEDGTLNSWVQRREPLSDYIDSLDLDVFGLQEVFEIQASYLNNSLETRNYTWIGIGRESLGIDGNTGEHDVIFYDVDKFSLLDNGTKWFSDTPEISSRTWLTETIKRTYVWAHLKDKATGTEFFFYNTHYGFYPEFHIKASIQLNKDISQRTADLPVIVTGDFNMPPIFPFYSFLEGVGSKPIYNAFRLIDGYIFPIEIDYIFITSNIYISSCEERTEANEGTQWLSDHDPIVMECLI
ncbi:MAG: hypothetical protein GF364_21355 [Candidatus Lokiarchaeota archaeon]|nr:hypothetical protein [Candidatus Lokiarchaeota archaeon]